jgi:RNase adaptor protein for sRNA GlmZ degradation
MKPGELVRVVKRNERHGGKVAVVIDVREQKSTFEGNVLDEVVDVLMEGAIRTSVHSSWFEAIDE